MNCNGAHLSYCLNIHPSESWQETFTAIDTYARAVKNGVCPETDTFMAVRIMTYLGLLYQDLINSRQLTNINNTYRLVIEWTR